MKPRVLQLIGSFHNGGSERQAVGLTRLLKDEGSFDVSVAVLNDEGPLREDVEQLGLGDIPEFPLTSFFRPSFVRQVRALAEHLRQEKIDIIHTHDFYTNVMGMAAAASAGTFVRIAAKRETDAVRTKGQDRVERIAFAAASKIVVNSAAVRDHLVARGIKDTRMEVIHNGVDLSAFDKIADGTLRTDYDLPEDAKILTLVANLRHPVKNVPMFLRSADRVLQKRDDVCFVIAGEGELKTDLEAMSVQLGIEAFVYFIGRCDRVPELLAESRACVLTSSAEGFSNSILEYMASTRPVVATNVGGTSEAVEEGETGYLVALDDDLAMAERLNDLLADKELAEKFGRRGRAKIEQEFTAEKQLEATLSLYNKFLRN